MNEDFLQYIWKFQQFNHNKLLTTSGDSIEILKAGLHNFHSGPDFFNGQIRLDGTRWAGNIEIHIKSSDWRRHKHQADAVYDKVILHVVWSNDQQVFRKDGQEIPTIELKGLVQKRLLDEYENLIKNSNWIPCYNQVAQTNQTLKRQLIDQKLVERLQIKSDRIEQLLLAQKNDWEASLYQLLAKYFGFKVNATPFEILATSIPFQLIRKHQANQIQLEALLFGQAGFLQQDFSDEFPKKLSIEYNFLKKKFGLKPMELSIWKFMRMRPANFPTIRISQFASLLHKNPKLFQQILETKDIQNLKKLFKVGVNTYWKTHYQFEKNSKRNSAKNLGDSSIEVLLINVVVPILFAYGRRMKQQDLIDRALHFLEKLKPEKNNIIKKWESLNFPIESAYESQALIQLKTQHCDFKNCLLCTIGNSILKEPA